MPSHGRRALAAAEQRLAAMTGAADDDGANSADEQTIALQHPVAGVVHVPSWESLAREQADIDEKVLEDARDGTVFALHDRNLLSMPWRQVFAVRDGEHFWVLDNKGYAIDEPHDGVHKGRQLVETLVQEFNSDGHFFYKPGRVRRSPNPNRQRAQQVCQDITPNPTSSLGASSEGVRKLHVW